MSTRSYPVPRNVGQTIDRASPTDNATACAIAAAATGRVSKFHLPLLASSHWAPAAAWASSVIDREAAATERRAEALLASANWDPESYIYYGVLDPGYPDHELIVSVARSPHGDHANLERWDGLDWGTAGVGPDGLEYVLLDRDVLVDVLDAMDTGSAGVVLRPFDPKAWVRDGLVLDYPIVSAAPPPRNTGAMVALYPEPDVAQQLAIEGGEPVDDLHITLAYLGDTTETPIDYAAVQRAVTKWARRMGPLTGEIAGSGLFTGGEVPVTVALPDIPDLPEARQMLVRMLTSEGVRVANDHGYTPHITLAYDDIDVDPGNIPIEFNDVAVVYADDRQDYSLGRTAVAASANPDGIYAIVDEFDASAVLDIIRVTQGPVAYRRSGGKWVKDNDMLRRLMGVDPPPVVRVPREQTQSVIDQVDSYDRENPPEPVTAAVQWSEEKHKRGAGGKFTSKGSSGASGGSSGGSGGGGGSKASLRRTSAPKAASGPSREARVTARAASFYDEPWRMLEAVGPNDRLFGLDDSFWSKQPDGFREFALNFLRDMRAEAKSGGNGRRSGASKESDDGRNEKGERKGEAGDNKRDVAHGKQRSAAQIAAQKKAAAAGGKKQGATNLRRWMKKVPPKYREAMRDLIRAVANRSVAAGPKDVEKRRQSRITKMDQRDRDFDNDFARNGLAEARKREEFDRGIVGSQDRLNRSGANPRAVASVMRKKLLEEKRRRADFERKRRVDAEAERVRRLKARNGELDTRDLEDALVAASRMPGDLKEYWVAGKGAAKIRWGTSGDFNRCRKALAKYLEPQQIAGACANLHKLATGIWPGKGREH